MCNPLALALSSFGLQTVGALSSASAQAQMYKQNAENARRSAVNQYGANQQRMMQEQQAAAAEQDQVSREARMAASTANVAAGEAGVSGNSVNNSIRSMYARADQYNAQVGKNLDWTLAQLQSEQAGVQYQAQDRIDSVARPSFADTMLRIGGAALDSTGTYYQMKNYMGKK